MPMKKIMFNDLCRLTQAVLDRRKTNTRRIVPERLFQECRSNGWIEAGGFNAQWKEKSLALLLKSSPYKVGEEVAVAQSYKDCMLGDAKGTWINYIHSVDPEISYDCDLSLTAGDNNKMFVRASLMPHRIRITDVRVERLQDISEEDCFKEGVIQSYNYCQHKYLYGCSGGNKKIKIATGAKVDLGYDTAQEAFSYLIDKTCGRGTWDSNPYVFVYDFELIR